MFENRILLIIKISNKLKNRIGRFFTNKIGLNFYKRKPDEWKQIQTNEFKKRKMFADLLDDDATNGKKNNDVKKLKQK